METTAPPESDQLLRWFRVVAVIEAVSYLCLIAASIVKRTTDSTDLVPVIGPIHGVIFLVYLALALTLRPRLRWDLRTTILIVVAAVIPLGGIVVEQRVARTQQSA